MRQQLKEERDQANFSFRWEIIVWLYADENDPEERERNDDDEKKMGKLMEQYLYELEMEQGLRHIRQLWRVYLCLE